MTVGVASELIATPADRARVLPVHDQLAPLFPWGGLRRGSTIAVLGSTSLLFAVLAEATANGSWAAVVGQPDLGVVAAAEHGVATDRLALIPQPGSQTTLVIAALLDGVDLVAVGTAVNPAHARRLSARARHRGSVLISRTPWPAADLELTCEHTTWTGLGAGHGHLRAHTVTVRAQGRGAAAHPTRATLRLPTSDDTRPVFEPQEHHPSILTLIS
jgi:hypothetical protein